jgi:hypothetical protein
MLFLGGILFGLFMIVLGVMLVFGKARADAQGITVNVPRLAMAISPERGRPAIIFGRMEPIRNEAIKTVSSGKRSECVEWLSG